MTHLYEDKLILLAGDGDSGAFTELVRRYRDAVYGYCYYRTGNFEDARDLCQDTFIRAYARLSQLRDAGKFGAWLRRIAANLCTRWAERRRELPVEEVPEPEPPMESPEEAFVRDALGKLPDTTRLAVVMFYVDGLSYADIAGFLDISKDAVRGRLHRGRRALRDEVLKMTREAFEDHSLDEEFVINAAKAAVREAHDAQNVFHDKDLARTKTGEAVELLDRLSDGEVEKPRALADQLVDVAMREFCAGGRENGLVLLERARRIYERLGDPDGGTRYLEARAYERLTGGDPETARRLYSQVLEHRRSSPAAHRREDLEGIAILEAAIHGIESARELGAWENVRQFHAGFVTFRRDEKQQLFDTVSGLSFGFVGEGFPAHLLKGPMPPRPPIAYPRVLLPTEPELGYRLLTDVGQGNTEESRVESLSDEVVTPAGTFRKCLRTANRILNRESGTVAATRELWFAPGVGVVRSRYQAGGDPADTAELADYAVAEPSEDYVPLAVGNRWRYRWAEGEDRHGYRTGDCAEIIARVDDAYVALRYVLCAQRSS